VIKTVALASLLALAPGRDPWFGADKVKHALVSAFVHSVTFSAARAAGFERPIAQGAAASVTLGVGFWKERRDKATTGRFSARDLGWDAAGSLAAAAILNGTR